MLRPLTASVCCDLTANLAGLGDLARCCAYVVLYHRYCEWHQVSQNHFALMSSETCQRGPSNLYVIFNPVFFFSCNYSPHYLEHSIHILDLSVSPPQLPHQPNFPSGIIKSASTRSTSQREIVCHRSKPQINMFSVTSKKKARQTHSCHSGAARGLTDSERHILPEQIQYLPNKYMMQDQREDNRSESTHTEKLEMKDQTSEELFLREHRRREMSERRLFLL